MATLKVVLKSSGQEEAFDPDKILAGIWMAVQEVGEKDKSIALELQRKVLVTLRGKYKNGDPVPTIDIGKISEEVLIESGRPEVAKAYILYRENKRHIQQDKDSLGVKDDIGLSYNTLFILKSRYLKRNEKGETVETPKGMVSRVAKTLSSVEKDSKLQDIWNKKFYDLMVNFDFLPGTRTLANAGKNNPQLANCFVFPLDDDINHIFEILYKSTLIKKHGGGCGYNFSKIRPEGDVVSGIPDLAGGPIKMFEMFDLMTSIFKQEGKYESGNMAILNVNHPDIFNFISAKKQDGYLSKSNLSVGITDEFMHAAISGKDWLLVNPRNGEVVNTVKAKSVLELMAQMAWATGDPGMINLSAVNKGDALGNPLLVKRGPIWATNVCGEIPLYPFESCNLGYFNLPKFVSEGRIDFERFKSLIPIAVRLMDNVIDASWFPSKEVTDSVRNHRRLGIGIVGWAETLIVLGIPYDSEEAYSLAEKVTKCLYETAFEASCSLAREKGSFPFVSGSIWANRKVKPRNVALITFPPSSGNAVICETSYGIEPLFALVYEQNVMGGQRFQNVNKLFFKTLKSRGLYSQNIIQKILENHGSVQGIKEVPPDLRKIFKVAHDIDWKAHIRMQAAFQKWTDNAITKTINMPSYVTPQDVEDAYILAWKLGCKGLTIYRDKTKDGQVIDFGKYESKKIFKGKMCPNCSIKLVKENKCYKCKKCGFSTCDL